MSLSNLLQPAVFNTYITPYLSLYGKLSHYAMTVTNLANTILVPNISLVSSDVFNNAITCVLLANGNLVLPEPEAVFQFGTISYPVGYTFDFVVMNNSGAGIVGTLINSPLGHFTLAAGGAVAPAATNSLRVRCIVTNVSPQPTISCYAMNISINSNLSYVMSPYMDGTVYTDGAILPITFTTSTATQILNANGWNSPGFIGKEFTFRINNNSATALALLTFAFGAGVTFSFLGNATVIGLTSELYVDAIITNTGANPSITMSF
jgi:hypothetical protein